MNELNTVGGYPLTRQNKTKQHQQKNPHTRNMLENINQSPFRVLKK